MRNFLASMAMVSGTVVIVTTFNNGVSTTSVAGGSMRSSVNEQSIVVNTTPQQSPTSDVVRAKPRVHTRVFNISKHQIHNTFKEDEVISFKNVNGGSRDITKAQIDNLASGVYLIRTESKIYRYLKRN
ncbi:MAG: hypothetical protein OCC49_18510 [Fibrobacterales bacterium]